MARLSEEQRLEILRLHDARLPYRVIAKKIGCSFIAAWKVVSKRDHHGTVQDLPKTGRPAKFHLQDKLRFARAVQRDNRATAAGEARVFKTNNAVQILVCYTSIWTALQVCNDVTIYDVCNDVTIHTVTLPL